MRRLFVGIILLAFPSLVFGIDVVPGLKVFGGSTRAAYGNGQNPTICIVDSLNPTDAIADETRNGGTVNVKTGGLKTLIDYDVDNKLIIFEVSGNIVVNNFLSLDNNYVTIAGQTAPSPGIVIQNGTINITGHDVLVQHIRVRMTDSTSGPDLNARDGINVYSYNTIIDHCSVSWATDENMGVGLNAHDSTVVNSIIAEGLRYGRHPEGKHSMGLICDGGENIGIVNNLFIHNNQRNPLFTNSGQRLATALISNNLIYNPGEQSWHNALKTTADDFNSVSNVLIGGPSSGTYADSRWPSLWWNTSNTTDMYIYDTRIEEVGQAVYTQSSADDWTKVRMESGSDDETYCKVLSLAFPYPSGYTPILSIDVEAYVLANAGARPFDRDVVDTRLVNDVSTDDGRIIDTILYTSASCTAVDVPMDCCTGVGTGNCIRNDEAGVPSLAQNVDTHNDIPSSPHADSDGDGYTNLEEWIYSYTRAVEDMKAFGHNPANGSTNISASIDLTWMSPGTSTSIDLLMDKRAIHDPPTTVKLNDQNVESYDCGTLEYNTEYAWRVDVNHVGGTEIGDVYYFTTESGGPLPTILPPTNFSLSH